MSSNLQLHGLAPAETVACDNAPTHFLIDCGMFCALASQLDVVTSLENSSEADMRAWASAHNAILQAYCTAGPILPIAPGSIFSNQNAVVDALTPNGEAYQEALENLSNKREFLVHLKTAPLEESEIKLAQGGSAFLLAKSRKNNHRVLRSNQRNLLAAKLRETIRSCAVQFSPCHNALPDRLINDAILVEVDQISALRRILQENGPSAEALGLILTITGPVPPYSFASTAIESLRHAS